MKFTIFIPLAFVSFLAACSLQEEKGSGFKFVNATPEESASIRMKYESDPRYVDAYNEFQTRYLRENPYADKILKSAGFTSLKQLQLGKIYSLDGKGKLQVRDSADVESQAYIGAVRGNTRFDDLVNSLNSLFVSARTNGSCFGIPVIEATVTASVFAFGSSGPVSGPFSRSRRETSSSAVFVNPREGAYDADGLHTGVCATPPGLERRSSASGFVVR